MVAVASDGGGVIVDAVAGVDFAAVVDHAPAVVGPDANHLRRDVQRSAPHQLAAFHPGVHYELRRRLRALSANDGKLLLDGRADQARAAFRVLRRIGDVFPEGTIVAPSQTDRPDNLLVRGVLRHRTPPSVKQPFRAVGRRLGPLINVQPQRFVVVLADHQSPLAGARICGS